MQSSDHQPALWSNTQTYTMAVICLMLGVVAGFLSHSPGDASPKVPASAAATPAAPGAVTPQMPSAADLKRMADKQVAPLLEQLKKNPQDADLLARIAHSYMAAQQFHSARQYYEESITVKPKAEVLNELAFVYVKMGDLDKGIATLRQALTIDPKNANVLYNLGFYEWEGKADAKAAIEAWRTLLNVDPKNAKRVAVEQMMTQAKKHLGIAPGTKTDKPAT